MLRLTAEPVLGSTPQTTTRLRLVGPDPRKTAHDTLLHNAVLGVQEGRAHDLAWGLPATPATVEVPIATVHESTPGVPAGLPVSFAPVQPSTLAAACASAVRSEAILALQTHTFLPTAV